MTPRLFNLNIFWVIDTKIDFSAINSKKFVYYNEELVTNSKFQTQLSRKLQRFRTCHKNKKCSIFHDLSEYIFFSYGCKLLDWSFKPVRHITNCSFASTYCQYMGGNLTSVHSDAENEIVTRRFSKNLTV